MEEKHLIEPKPLTVAEVEELIELGKPIALSGEAEKAVERCRTYLDRKLAEEDSLYYGINTGFGALCNVTISKDQIEELQKNLVMSHACGMGERVPAEIVRIMLFLKVQTLAFGHSGISPDTIHALIQFYNYRLWPVVYTQGSLGASGDLAPLAHLSLPLIGEGEIHDNGVVRLAAEALREKKISPVTLKCKEGLALLNGTQFMGAYGVHLVIQAQHIAQWADLIGALSVDAFDAKTEPFSEAIHRVRNQKGQQESAANIRSLLKGSAIAQPHKPQVQDPYSFRCMPQVHGASRDALEYVKTIVENEISGVTDNPNIFPESDEILSGGNFHGQPLALVLDHLAIALAEWGSISERRTYLLVSGQRGLPAFLTSESGLHSGLMIPQYTAASMVSQNKQLCTPASVDTIPSSNGQEDHVSMGANAATKALRVLDNVYRILAIELLSAAQALEFRRPQQSSKPIEKLVSDFREKVPHQDKDHVLYHDMRAAEQFLRDNRPETYYP